ncbi:MAG: hypothetical protein J6O61_07270 [Butyrivibrio sp.]|uniref:hypothetical protein n=1 Tax=Butyrivibrio sp. TaxID=28121 RepID=UPI001B015CC2|nr:hypothetical protein [Butyrivibrio sp.]MBO6240615.1 hypothetical protein [Butyrivibrio sp.]
MGNKEPNIDDFFRHTEAISKKMHEYMAGKSFDEKFATAMLNATDADSKFKADVAMKLSTVLNMIEMLVEYVNKPVKKEGILQRKLDGTVMLEDTHVPVGSLVEYWKDEKWNVGKIAQNPQTKQLSIIDVVSNKTMVDKIEQIKARVR